jgi:hypothetical protein
MRNTIDMTRGQPNAILSQSVSGIKTVKTLVALYITTTIHPYITSYYIRIQNLKSWNFILPICVFFHRISIKTIKVIDGVFFVINKLTLVFKYSQLFLLTL